jgi:hypothetical protein
LVVEIKMRNVILGLIIGLALFLGPGLITGNGGLLGADLISGLSLGLFGLLLLGVSYAVIGGVLYGLFLKFKNFSEVVKKSINFSVGIILAYLIFWIIGLFAFSNFGF